VHVHGEAMTKQSLSNGWSTSHSIPKQKYMNTVEKGVRSPMLPLSDITLVLPFDTINSIFTLENLSHCQIKD
jgi:hypothetical protein